MNYKLKNFTIVACILFITIVFISSCEDFVDIDPPKNELVTKTVFEDDATATSALLGVYGQMGQGFVASGFTGGSYILSTLSDDLKFVFATFPERLELYNNEILPTNSIIQSIWSQLYEHIFQVNTILEEIENSKNLSEEVARQLKGEALFIRAFSYFYLENLFGDVPLTVTTDFEKNRQATRAPRMEIYTQIIDDLLQAKEFLSEDYSFSNEERVRPNKATAASLLARAYLYIEDWASSEVQATETINNSLYSLATNLNDVFLANSSEAIWQWAQTESNNTSEGSIFPFTFFAKPTEELINSFEDGDDRRSNWMASDAGGELYPFKYKLQAFDVPKGQEYSMILRLAEQYLIRAEARAHQGNLEGAREDLNMIRNRAGLLNTTASDKNSVLLAIEEERRVELFTEWGHRWLDLKRTKRADEILGGLKPGWQPTDILLPIPEIQLLNNPNMTDSQNPGY